MASHLKRNARRVSIIETSAIQAAARKLTAQQGQALIDAASGIVVQIGG